MARKMPLTPHRRRSTDSGNNRRWIFERRISLDTLVGIVGIAFVIGGPLLLAWRAIDSRILTIEIRDEARSKNDDKRDTEAREFRTQISTQLGDLAKQMTATQITLGVLSGAAKAPADGRK